MSDILSTEPVIRLRPTAGTRGADGRYVPGAPSAASIAASVQPLSGKEVETLPEGERRRDWLKLYTHSELRPVDQHSGAAGTAADRVIIDGAIYEVRRVARQRSIIPHYRAFVVRVQEGGA